MHNRVASARVFYVLRDLRAEFWLRPVTVSSPHSPDDCLRRLAEVTTAHGATWYLKPETAVLRDPQLRGNVGPSGIHVARFRDSIGRNNFLPWLDARFESAPSGGTILAGTIGPQPGSAGLKTLRDERRLTLERKLLAEAYAADCIVVGEPGRTRRPPGLAVNRDLDLAEGREVEPAAVVADAGHVRAARVAGRALNGGAVERGAGPRGQGEFLTTVRLACASPVTTPTVLSV